MEELATVIYAERECLNCSGPELVGEAKSKKSRFLEAHPTCCFCGGNAKATTIDHVPNRASFVRRLAPEGFEFPACGRCQDATRLDEIAFALMVHLAHHGDDRDQEQFRKLLDGIKNNLPDLLPNARLTSLQKRRGLERLGLNKPEGVPYADIPAAEIPDGYHDIINRYIRKITLALFYRHLGFIAGPEMRLWSKWSHGHDRTMDGAINSWSEITPFVDVGKRTNVDIGEGFRARVNYSSEMNAFVTIGQFHRGLIFFGSCMPSKLAERIGEDHESPPNSYCPGDWS